MKIYNKKQFTSGLISLMIFLMALISVILRGLSIKIIIIMPILLLFSITEIRISFSKDMSKKNLIENEDERAKYISLKTSHKSLKILQDINIVVVFISMILYAVTKSIFWMGAFILSSVYMTLIFAVELAANIYYEKHE